MCIGCYRNRAEIGEWARADDERRFEIVETAEARRIALTAEKEKRA
jgi:predicted Fe-S protein YdhL (DUF1289 family)